MRANSLTNLGVALDYNVASNYDKVLVLSGIASEIEELAPHANEIATLVANLPDVLTVQEASELVNNLTVKVTTLPEGSTATSELIGTEIRLGIPAGAQGVQGTQGPKGDKGDRGDIGLTGAKGPTGATGPQGPRGFRGEDGLDGEGVVITSILNNLNKSLTINFSDGTQHTTDPLKGEDGRSVTITNVVNNANGTMLINFSDGTSHHTADLTGPRGFKGDTGDHVHHISYQRSKDPLGNEVGPVAPSQKGNTDTYAMWASQEELPEMYIGEFTVYNGLNTLTAEEQVKFDSVEFGATADQEAFEVPYDNTTSGLLSEDVQNSIDELSATKLNILEKGQPNGVAELDANGLVPSAQLPSYVDDVIEVNTYADLPVEGETGKIYVVVSDETSNGDTLTYRWTGTTYAMVSNTLDAGDVKALYEANPDTNEYSDAEKVLVDVGQVLETTATTLPTAINELVSVKVDKIVGSSLVPDTKVSLYDSHIIDTANPHAVTKAQVGLGNADNTSDNVKNVLSATKWTTARTLTLRGDISGSISVDGSSNVTMETTVQPDSVELGADTTGNYMVDITAGDGISVSHTQGEGSTAIITNSEPNVTTDISTTHNSNNVVVHSSDGTDGTIDSATQALAGVMSAADKTKLDGIQAGAQVNTVNSVNGRTGAVTGLVDGQAVGVGVVRNYNPDITLEDQHINGLGSASHGNRVPLDGPDPYIGKVLYVGDAEWGTQLWFSYNEGKAWFRNKNTGKPYEAWKEFIHTGNIRTSLGYSIYPVSQKLVTDQLASKANSSHTHPHTQVTGLGTAASSNVVQATGQSATGLMSQKAVTDALNTKVGLTDNQTISGTKTFSINPISSAKQSTAVNALTRKDYVDDLDNKNVKKSANLSDLANTSIARTNLGLGTAATRDVGTNAGNMMEVGAFGLGRYNDLRNTIYTTGTPEDLYESGYVIGFTDGSKLSPPIGGLYDYGTLEVKMIYGGLSGMSAYSRLFTRNGRVYIQRALNATTWGPWHELISTGNILSSTGQSTQFPMTQKAVTDAINGLSDERDKTEINEIDLGLEVIEKLKTFSFKLNMRDWYRQEAAKELIEVEEDGKVTIQEKINDDVLNAPLSSFEENDGSLKRDDVYTGFVAQDLKETLGALDLGHLGIVKNYAEEYEGGEDRFYIEHLALLPFLVNSVKQLSARVKALEGRQGEEVE